MPRNKGNNRYNRKRCMLIICRDTAHSDKSLIEICKAKCYLPKADTVQTWLGEASDRGLMYAQMYARAKDQQIDYVAFDTMRIAEGENTNKARNMIDARKWLAAKLNPRKYGDRLEFTGALDITRDVSSLETALAVSSLLEKIAARAGIKLSPDPEPANPPQLLHKIP